MDPRGRSRHHRPRSSEVNPLGVIASILTATEIGQSSLAILVTLVGYILHRKSEQIHVLVNSRLDEALGRITALEHRLGLQPGEAIPTDPSQGGDK